MVCGWGGVGGEGVGGREKEGGNCECWWMEEGGGEEGGVRGEINGIVYIGLWDVEGVNWWYKDVYYYLKIWNCCW